MLLSYMSFFAG